MFFRLDDDLKKIYGNHDVQQLKTLIADTIFQVHDAHTYLLPGDQDLEVSSPQTWRDNMLDANKITWCDDTFVYLTAELLKREIILVPINKEDGHGNTGLIRYPPRETTGNPLHFLYYVGIHYQSIIPRNL